jgi:hypothetical protein
MTESNYEREEYLEQDEEEVESNGRRKAVVALLVVGILVVVTLFIVQRLRTEGELQDCLMTHASNCSDLVAPPKPIGQGR